MESRVSKVLIKKVHLVKIRGKWCVVVQFYPWFKFYFFRFKLIIITSPYPKTKENKIEPQHIKLAMRKSEASVYTDWNKSFIELTDLH